MRHGGATNLRRGFLPYVMAQTIVTPGRKTKKGKVVLRFVMTLSSLPQPCLQSRGGVSTGRFPIGTSRHGGRTYV